MSKLLKIDELTIGEHFYLTLGEDECWYLFNYTAKEGFAYSKSNSLILNLKKSVEQRLLPHYAHKISAIKTVASHFSRLKFSSNMTIVPIPPSKAKNDPLYDDRMLQILQQTFSGNPDVDIRELVVQLNSKKASHLSDIRPSLQELQSNYTLDPALCVNLKDTILLVDDVLTSGAHFKAIKNVLRQNFPKIKVKGLFICRREINDDCQN